MTHAVIIGQSVPGLCLASALQRRGVRTTLIAPKPTHEPRLVNGCSLRRSTVAIMARAMGTSPEELAREFREQSVFGALEVQEATGRALVGRRMFHRSKRLIGLSSRHGHILDVLRARLPGGIEHVEATVSAYDAGALVTSTGRLDVSKAFVVNASPKPLVAQAAAPQRFVTVVQAPMRHKPGREKTDVAYAPWLAGAQRPHLAFYTPFYDPAWPDATFYGINTSVERAEKHDRDAALSDVRERLFEMGEAYGLEPVGGDAARGETCVPVTHSFACDAPLIEASIELSSGAPAILLDGMLAGARGAEVIADAYAGGAHDDALPRVRKALKKALSPIRGRNRMAQGQFYFAPVWLQRFLQRWSPQWLGSMQTEDMANLGLT